MTYRIDDLIVPGDDPFKNDALDRKPLVTNLAGLIGNLNGPFVMVLDAPWGSGKTTLVRMLKAHLESEDFQCIYFNAWEVDYASDPLIAMVSAIDRMDFSASPEAAKTFKNCMKAVKKAAPGFLKRIVVAGTKVVTMGVLDLGAATSERIIADATGETVDSIVDLFARESDQLKTFREELTKAVEQLPEAQKKPDLVFFIDELDRCRPTFAIELLERVKHLFNIPNIVFVLSIDKQQLEASTKAVYGAESNAPEYLRRFFDMEYSIPAIPDERYTANLLARFGLDPVFAERTGAGF
ncbi:MAG: KAP family NTPase, partial [Azoarcus sp.]|nr:KAP family NTPase [Azoarcus sp.]